MQLLIETEAKQGYPLLPQPDLPHDLIVEDRVYTLRLTADSDDAELAGCRLLLGDVDWGAGRYVRRDQVSWRWQVRDYVGEVTVGVEDANGNPLFPIREVLVDPNRSKLTRDQFAVMVNDISAQAIIAYTLSPATRRIELGRRREAFNLAQLEYIRQQIEPLRKAVEAIARRPRRVLVDEDEIMPLSRARAPDDRSIAWLLGRPRELTRVEHSAVPVGVQGLHRRMRGHLPERLQVSRRRVTYDTYENRLLKHFLRRLNTVLCHTQMRLTEASAMSNRQLDEQVIRLARRRQNELKDYRRILYNLLDLDFLREVGALRQLKPVTPTLRKDPHYARFYDIYRRFDRAITPFDGDPFKLSLEKTWQLYEYWCFFQVVAALRQIVGEAIVFDARPILEPHPDRVSLTLPAAAITVNPRVHVRFQNSYPYYGWYTAGEGAGVGTYSHEMRPDISIEISGSDGQLEQIIVLDPKYRVSGRSLNEAMDDLHRYKDAIVGPDRRRLVHTALALCPSSERAKGLYFRPDYIRTHGLGALVLRPGDDRAVESLASNLERFIFERTYA
jgi:predicted component of viral defense system (DUF524 family)